MGWKDLSGLAKGGIIGAIIGFLLGIVGTIISYSFSTCPAGMACAVSPITKLTSIIIAGVVLAVLGFIIGNIIGHIIEKRKTGEIWKNTSYWVKGEIIGVILLILDILVLYLTPIPSFMGILLGYLVFPFNLVILGIIIGVIIGKIKHKS